MQNDSYPRGASVAPRDGGPGRPRGGAYGHLRHLEGLLRARGRLLVLLSGGEDSSCLAWAARRTLGGRAEALTLESPLDPDGPDRAVRAAARIGMVLHRVASEELSDPIFAAHPADRCYRCRKHRDALALSFARSRGFSFVADGALADDDPRDRRGMAAAGEDGILSPLREAGWSKEDVREALTSAGLAELIAPSIPCLATRFPYGEPLTREGLRRAGAAESAVAALGFSLLRVRCFPRNLALVEVPREEAGRLLSRRDELISALGKLGFDFVSLDLEGFRSGTMERTARPGGAGTPSG